ncbi:hypothetical protein GCM10027037_25090 [Mucilaginibacter koreensis]
MSPSPRRFTDRQLLDILALSKDATAIYAGEDIVIEMANDAMIAFWGKGREVVGLPLEEAVPELKDQPFISILKDVWRTGVTYIAADTPAQLQVNGKLQTFYYSFEYRALKNEDGTTYCILHTAADVTEQVLMRKRIAESESRVQSLNEDLAASNEELKATNEELSVVNFELNASNEGLKLSNAQYNSAQQEAVKQQLTAQENENKFKAVIEQSPVAIIIFRGPELVIDAANPPMLNLLDQQPDIIGQPLLSAIPELAGQPACNMLYDIYRTGQPVYGYETPVMLKRNGKEETGYFNFSYTPLIENEEITGIIDIAVEVTEQVKSRLQLERTLAEKIQLAETLANSEARLQGILDTMAEGVGLFDANGKVFYLNHIGQRMLNLQLTELTQRAYNDEKWQNLRLDGSLLPFEEHPIYTTLKTGKPVFDQEIGVLAPGKEVNYLSINTAPLFDSDGILKGGVGTFMDVTERRKLTNQLVESENQLRGLFEQAPLGMALLRGPEHITELANDNILRIWGRSREEMIGRPHAEARPELQGQPIIQWLKEVYHTGTVRNNGEIAIRLYHHGGLRDAYINSVYQPIKNAEGVITGVLIILEDVTEAVHRKQEIERAQQMFSLAVQSAELGTWYIDTKTRKFVPSVRLKELFGYYPDEEMLYEAAVNQVAEEYRSKVVAAVEAAITQNSGYDLEYPILGYHDQQLRWVKATGRLYPATDDQAAFFAGTVIDITDRKELEQRKDDFISIASHELKTPITSLKAALQLMGRLKNNPSPTMLPKMIDQANRSMDKITTLIDDLLNATRMNEGQMKLNKTKFTIYEMLNGCCHHIRVGGKHELIVQGDQDLRIYADEHRIDQVVVNFVNNAVKYAPNSREIYLIAERVNGQARIAVKDTGPGIAAEKLPYLFDRYYRVDHSGAQYSGLGLGLYISAEIIKRHGGEIGVDSEVGKGSTFWFTLPLAE